jgi:flavin reductase (DIM6/NTAB) family NADH-FMN oxidoreductase RutF
MSEKLASLFNTLSHGVYVVGVAAEGRHNAFTAACVMLASFNPPMLALSIHPAHSSWRLLKSAGGFSVNVLRQDQLDWALHFGQPASADKLAAVDWRASQRGFPILSGALAWFECVYVAECAAGDHVLVAAKVTDGAVLDAAGVPLDYRATAGRDGSAALFADDFAV